MHLQPGECPVVLELSTHETDVSSAALPVQGILHDTISKQENYAPGEVCFW